ncbi:MAG: Gfo/Idh/MocA family oxidoreductase [Lentisphaeria bacterium]|nr:Gfo/Idh/MocA family oxidoreductase [Lentisphaeria bacterium]NQZ66869.1 Gfo/Idh/MocA family oxidoreductase [Lentisphaeria bacterium]
MINLGIIGVGGMGAGHCKNASELEHIKLAAVCDLSQETADTRAKEYDCTPFTSFEEMLDSGLVDSILIAVPHFFHTPIAIAALEKGIHVLVEKPIAVHKADAERMIAAHSDTSVIFSAMFNQRTNPLYIEAKRLVESGELGEIIRTNYIVSDWFRSQAYYDSGSWRATWKGEGGGVLVNQCPHSLDLFQWICGMPTKIRAWCTFGKYHDIEVEDEVNAYMEYANGATGLFYTTTGEAPGTNRMEISGDKAQLIIENGTLTLRRNSPSTSEHIKNGPFWGGPETTKIDYTFSSEGGMHKEMIENFANAILNGADLIAPAEEGLHSVELANAMIYSSLTETTVNLPLDSAAYEEKLNELMAGSSFQP